MRCPHCDEYDIDEVVEIEPTYTEKEKTKIKELQEELEDAYTLIGEQGGELYRAKELITILENTLNE